MSRREALIEKFRGVVAERLAKLNEGMTRLGAHPDDAEALKAFARELHTLKGEAKLLGFTDMGRVALAVENLMATAERRRFAVSHQAVVLIYAGLELVDQLRTVSPGDAQPDVPAFLERASVLAGAHDP